MTKPDRIPAQPIEGNAAPDLGRAEFAVEETARAILARQRAEQAEAA